MGKHERIMPAGHNNPSEEPERRFSAPGFDAPDTQVINQAEIHERLPHPQAIVGREAVRRAIQHPNAMSRVRPEDLDARYGQGSTPDWAERMKDMGPKVNTTAELTRNPDGSITRTDGDSSYTYKSKLDHLNNDK